jgi:prolyl oligopeptidase
MKINNTPKEILATKVADLYQWLEAGGIFTVANIRGGGEFGKQWHEDGTKKNTNKILLTISSPARII